MPESNNLHGLLELRGGTGDGEPIATAICTENTANPSRKESTNGTAQDSNGTSFLSFSSPIAGGDLDHGTGCKSAESRSQNRTIEHNGFTQYLILCWATNLATILTFPLTTMIQISCQGRPLTDGYARATAAMAAKGRQINKQHCNKGNIWTKYSPTATKKTTENKDTCQPPNKRGRDEAF